MRTASVALQMWMNLQVRGQCLFCEIFLWDSSSQLAKQSDYAERLCVSSTPTKVSGPSLALAYPVSWLDLRGWPSGKWPVLAGSQTINNRFGVAKKPAVPMWSVMLVHAYRFVAFYEEFAAIELTLCFSLLVLFFSLHNATTESNWNNQDYNWKVFAHACARVYVSVIWKK